LMRADQPPIEVQNFHTDKLLMLVQVVRRLICKKCEGELATNKHGVTDCKIKSFLILFAFAAVFLMMDPHF
jgi:hypothetical protein